MLWQLIQEGQLFEIRWYALQLLFFRLSLTLTVCCGSQVLTSHTKLLRLPVGLEDDWPSLQTAVIYVDPALLIAWYTGMMIYNGWVPLEKDFIDTCNCLESIGGNRFHFGKALPSPSTLCWKPAYPPYNTAKYLITSGFLVDQGEEKLYQPTIIKLITRNPFH